MDILIPWDTDFDANGGKLAAPWGACIADRKLFDEAVQPFLEDRVRGMFDTVKHVSSIPPWGQLMPYTYIINDHGGEWKVTTHGISEKAKTTGSRKQFEADKRAGNIVLKAMRNCKAFGTATPRLYNSQPEARYGDVWFTKIGVQRPGVCRRSWNAIPELEVDCFADMVRVKQHFFKNAVVNPTPVSELHDVMREIITRLDQIEPDSPLVTQVVAEANAATWDIATELAEMPETVGYVLSTLKKGILLLLRFKRELKESISKGVVTNAASLWMQYRYAVMPIIYGVNDALDVLGMDARKFQSFRGRTDTPLFKADETVGSYKVTSSSNVQNRVFLKYKYDVDSKVHQGLQINLAATAWELVPFSFVFDWFFQVGDYLTAAFRPGVVDASGCLYSVRYKGNVTLEGTSFERLNIAIDYYRCKPINPNAFIGVNSDVFVSFKRAMDALSLSWLMFKKNGRRG